jgi:hypothetical protein
MILYSHLNLLRHPVIEFENFDGKLFQLIFNLPDVPKAFGPFRVDIKSTIINGRILIEISPEKEQINDEIIGLFYTSHTLSYLCVDSAQFTMAEFLSKIKVTPEYNIRLGFYRLGVQIDKYYLNYENKIAKHIWKLDEKGWVSIDQHGGNRNVRYT